jgi:tRNA nucleotidyltransferase/poly(A) polymerase
MTNPNLVLAWSDIVLDLPDLLEDYPDPVYIVGGAVRDALLRQPIKDVDIAVPKGGIKLARKIANAFGGDFFPLDSERDVGRAIVAIPDGRLLIDVSGFRGDSLEADLRDRDFTINAMAVDLHGDLNKVIDATGGATDALAKIIRRCNPDAIARDPIRALRAVRLLF